MSDLAESEPRAQEDWSPRAWVALLRELYFQLDRRTLGFSRILLGFLLLMDVLHRGRAWNDMYSSIGVLPVPLNLKSPQTWGTFSIFNAFDSPGELRVLWVLMVINAFCLMIGYRTKLAQVCAFVLQVGMNSRILLVENGGYVVNNLLVMWTMFLPMGDRLSVDAVLGSLRRRRETTAAELNDRVGVVAPGKDRPFTSLVCFAITIQIASIYYFNFLHKTGATWRNGTAVHYVLYVDRMATPIISLVRDHVPNFVILFMTRAAMTFEASIPVFLLQPLLRPWSRRVVIFMMCALHLAFGVTFVLGPFSWSCCIFATLLFTSTDWEIAARTMRRTSRARTLLFNPGSGAALTVCRVLKRLDRFELLTFEAREGLASGLAVEGEGSRHEALASIVAALPLGPNVAWLLRLPLVRDMVDGVLGAVEARDVSATLGISAAARPSPPVDAPTPTPRVSPLVVIPAVLVVAGSIALAFHRDQALSGVLLVLGTVALTAAVGAWFTFPVLSPRALGRTVFGAWREVIVLAMFAGAVDQGLCEMWVFNRRFKTPQPEALRLLSHKMRMLQGWFMFSPNPVTEDGTIVVDAVTVDGRHVDPFTGKPPNWDLSKSLGLSQLWCDYFNRIQAQNNAQYRDAMTNYMYRLPERTKHPGDALVSGDVYWVKELSPRWNETRKYNYDRGLIFSFKHPEP